VSDTTEVMGVPQAHDGDPVSAGALDRDVHRVVPDDLAETHAAVERQQRAVVEHGRQRVALLQEALLRRQHVPRDHADAVRVVAGEVGQHEVVCRECGAARIPAGALEDRACQGVKVIWEDEDIRGVGHDRMTGAATLAPIMGRGSGSRKGAPGAPSSPTGIDVCEYLGIAGG
jgi:hypothetical protein